MSWVPTLVLLFVQIVRIGRLYLALHSGVRVALLRLIGTPQSADKTCFTLIHTPECE